MDLFSSQYQFERRLEILLLTAFLFFFKEQSIQHSLQHWSITLTKILLWFSVSFSNQSCSLSHTARALKVHIGREYTFTTTKDRVKHFSDVQQKKYHTNLTVSLCIPYFGPKMKVAVKRFSSTAHKQTERGQAHKSCWQMCPDASAGRVTQTNHPVIVHFHFHALK